MATLGMQWQSLCRLVVQRLYKIYVISHLCGKRFSSMCYYDCDDNDSACTRTVCFSEEAKDIFNCKRLYTQHSVILASNVPVPCLPLQAAPHLYSADTHLGAFCRHIHPPKIDDTHYSGAGQGRSHMRGVLNTKSHSLIQFKRSRTASLDVVLPWQRRKSERTRGDKFAKHVYTHYRKGIHTKSSDTHTRGITCYHLTPTKVQFSDTNIRIYRRKQSR